MKKQTIVLTVVAGGLLLLLMVDPALAADTAASGGYLAGYEMRIRVRRPFPGGQRLLIWSAFLPFLHLWWGWLILLPVSWAVILPVRNGVWRGDPVASSSGPEPLRLCGGDGRARLSSWGDRTLDNFVV